MSSQEISNLFASPSPVGVAAVDRALAILETVAAREEPSTLAHVSAATGLYKSTVLRLLGSLEKAGLIVRISDGRYALGATAWRLRLAYERANPLRHHIMPVLEELVRQGSESPSFHVRHGADTRLCLFRIDSAHATLDRIRAGDVLPLGEGAAGRLIAAWAGEPGARFDAIRATSFAVSLGERDPSCAGLAAPVFGAAGAFVGALSLSGPLTRFTEPMIADWRPRLLAAAARISASLGGSYPAHAA